jgi:hypothetical protein
MEPEGGEPQFIVQRVVAGALFVGDVYTSPHVVEAAVSSRQPFVSFIWRLS